MAIRTHGLTRRFGDLVAVDGLDLAVPAGQITGFLGPNGAGKTTTLRMLLGLIQPDAGWVELFGKPFEVHRESLLSRTGALVEWPALYPQLTGRENLEIRRRILATALDLDPGQIDRILEFVDLVEAAERRVETYSLGMRQRLGLALAMLGDPELLILDEPTNGLDPAGIQDMRRLIQRLPESGVTVLLSSHLLAEVEQVASRVVIVDRGRCLFQGSLEDLRANQRGGVRVGVDRPRAAVEVLGAAGWVCAPHEDSVVVDATGRGARAEICRILVEHGLAVDRLTEDRSSLERLFLALTDGGEGP